MGTFGQARRTVSVLSFLTGVIGWSAAPVLLGPTASAAVVLPELWSAEAGFQPPPQRLLEARRKEVDLDALLLVLPPPDSGAQSSYETRGIEPYPTVDYKILFVQPDPTVDYKILLMQPDPTIDYKILVIDPHTKVEVNGLTDSYQQFYYQPFAQPAPKGE